MPVKPTKRMTRKLGTFMVLPICLLLLNAIEEVVVYKFQGSIRDPYLRTAMLLLMFTAGFTLVAAIVVPWTKALLKDLHKGSERHAGSLGSILLYALILALFYWLYFVIYVDGAEHLLPPAWR